MLKIDHINQSQKTFYTRFLLENAKQEDAFVYLDANSFEIVLLQVVSPHLGHEGSIFKWHLDGDYVLLRSFVFDDLDWLGRIITWSVGLSWFFNWLSRRQWLKPNATKLSHENLKIKIKIIHIRFFNLGCVNSTWKY